MGTLCVNEVSMLMILVTVCVLSVCLGTAEGTYHYKEDHFNNVHLTDSVTAEFAKLSRYCGRYNGYNGYFNYNRPSGGYYRPSNSGLNLASLIGPAVFGLATGGAAAAIAGLVGK